MPEDFDGRVLEAAFTAEESARPVRKAPPATSRGRGGGDDLSEDDMREIRNRLKGLGYLG